MSFKTIVFLTLFSLACHGKRKCAGATEHSNARLRCHGGAVITRIQFASYGLPKGGCGGYSTSNKCHASKSHAKVSKLCLFKSYCIVPAKNGVFGDPCFGKRKHLKIQFTCGKKPKCAGTKEHGVANLRCPGNDVITRIQFASYGLPNGSCGGYSTSNKCHASKSHAKVSQLCLFKNSCKVPAKNGVFGDPCFGKHKHLKIQFTCGACPCRVYEHCHFRGHSRCYHSSQSFIGHTLHDKASSIRVGPGYECRLFQHTSYRGQGFTYKRDDNCFTNEKFGPWYWRKNFNDRASSIRVIRKHTLDLKTQNVAEAQQNI